MSLGAKLNLALLVFLLLLGSAASAIVIYGFNRTQDNATERSQDALEEQGKLALQAVVGGVSEQGGLQFEAVAEIGRRSARYLDSVDVGAPVAFDAPSFTRSGTGLFYDPNPDRTSDLVVLNGGSPDDVAVQEDIMFSAPLDTIFPVLLEGFAGEVGGENLDPIAIVFISTHSASRYYPPIGIHEFLPENVDISERMAAIGPANNPERRTIWTAPYADGAGQGQIVTARTPVYEGDTFRGSMEVDLSIVRLIDQINTITVTPRGFAFYVDSAGDLFRSDAFELLNREAADNAGLAAVLEGMRRPNQNFDVRVETLMLEDEEFFVAYAPMLGLGGSFAVAAPVSDITARASAITAGIEDEGTRTFRVMLAAMGVLFVAGLVGAGYLNRRLLVQPLQQLAMATRAVAAGDRTAKVSMERRDELGDLAAGFNVMVDQLRESERSLERRVAARTRELDALLRADAELFQTLSLDRVLQALVDVAVDVLGVDKSLVTLWDRPRNTATVRAARNLDPESLALFTAILPSPQYGTLRDDVQPRVYQRLDDRTIPEALRAIMEREDILASMDVPIRSPSGEVIGGYGVGYTSAHEFGADEQRLLLALAERAAVAIQNAALYERAQQAASLEERQRLARELHDSVSQALYGIALGARTARLRLGDDPHNAAEPIDYVMSLAEAGLAEMRALIFELRPESLQAEGIVAAIEKQVASTKARYSLDIDADLGNEPDCALDVKEALYRIAQEALHNVVKHARAKHVEVRLDRDGDVLILAVCDDGRGFDPDGSFPGHVGLRSMPERAAKLGGTVSIESEPGTGTRVVARVPV